MISDPKRSSYVRVAREVLPTNHLNKFRERLEDIAGEFLPNRGSTVRGTARTSEELRREGVNPQMRTIGLPAATVYPINGLGVTLFERRLSRSQRANSNLVRLIGKLAEVDLLSLADTSTPETIALTASQIVETTSRLQDQTKREFSLVIDDGPALWRLRTEHESLHEYVGKSTRRSADQIISEDPWANPDVIPILSISRWTDKWAVNEFVQRMSFEGTSDPLVVLDLNIPELDSKIR